MRVMDRVAFPLERCGKRQRGTTVHHQLTQHHPEKSLAEGIKSCGITNDR